MANLAQIEARRADANARPASSADPGASDVITFARAWAAEPCRIGAILPSGDALSALITSEIGPDSGDILELGPGTGVFTEALLGRGVRQEKLTLIESSPTFAQLLNLRFPKARVVAMDAQELDTERLFEGRPLGAIISGLPLLSLAARSVERILAGAFAYARPSASLFQFSYSPLCPVPYSILERQGLQATRVGWTLRNVPPASVYRISRR
jgi:phospholipid N-methyltransferase